MISRDYITSSENMLAEFVYVGLYLLANVKYLFH